MVKSVYVPEAGKVINFADDITPAEVSGYINAKYPRAAAPAPAAGPDQSTVSQRALYGLISGFTEIPGGIASLMYPAEEAAQTEAGKWSAGNRAYLEKTLNIDPTKEATTAQTLAQGLGSIAGFLIPSGAVGKGASLLGAGARAAELAGTATVAAQGAALNAGQRSQTIQQQLASGMKISPETQLAAQRLDGLIGLSEALPMHKFFGPIGTILSKVPASKAPLVEKIITSRLAKITKAGAEEAAQEAASNIASDLMEYGVYNPDVQVGQDVMSNAAGGAFAGSVLEGVIQLAAGRKLRGARQLQADLQEEKQKNTAELHQISIAEAANTLANSGVEGNVILEPNETPEGSTVYTLMGANKQPIANFHSEDDAVKAVDLYKQMTGANVNIDMTGPPKLSAIRIGNQKFPTLAAAADAHRKIRARVSQLVKYGDNFELVSKDAAAQGFPPQVYFKKITDEINATKQKLSMFDRYFSAEEPVAEKPLDYPKEPKAEPGSINILHRDENLKGKWTTYKTSPVNDQPMPNAKAPEPAPSPVEEPAVEEYKPEEDYTDKFNIPEPITSEEEIPNMPIGSVEMPVEESRILPDSIVEEDAIIAAADVAAPEVVAPEAPKETVQRPSATVEDLVSLKEEIFGKNIGWHDMTPEQRAVYEAERDKRFPPENVDVYQSAGPLREPAPRNLREAHMSGPTVRDYTPATKAWLQNIYAKLADRAEAIVPGQAKIELKTLVGANPNYLIRGQARTVETQYGIKSIVDLSTGILRPGMSVEDAVESLVGTLNHELIHVLRDKGVLRPEEWRILSRAVANTKIAGKKYTYLDKAEAIYVPDGMPMSEAYANPDAVIEEAVAEMYRDWVLNGQKPPQQTVGLFNRITEFFRRIFQTLRNARHDDIFKQIEAGEIGRREGTPRAGETRASAGPVYNPLTSSSDWETDGAPPAGISSVNLTNGSPYRISQRRPVGKNLGASLAQNLLVDTATMQGTPNIFAHNVDILKTYPNMRFVPGETPEQTLARFKEHVIENLLWLHDTMDPGLRVRAKNWYDGARAITDRLAKKYNLPDTTVAAVMAGLSPQKDWFQNVSLGERVIDIMMTKGQHKFDDKMMRLVLATPSMSKYAPLLQLMEGRTLDEITNFNVGDVLARKHNEILAGVANPNELRALSDGVTTYGKAIFVRFYDQAHKSRDYNIVTPEGGTGAIATTGKGLNAKVAWGSFGEIGKAIDAILDGKKENIDALLGNKHKIRNFYNNIISPMSTDGSVTIDTHAVAAALLRPLAGGSLEVHHNFGTSVKGMPTRTKNSDVTGLQGTYAFYADAYREAAARRGVLAREMQSITWEAVRGLYKPTYKAQRKNVDIINAIWENYRNGVIDANEARSQILNHADPGAVGINNPFWKNTPGSSLHGGSGPALNTGGVGRLGVRQAAKPVNGRGTGGNAGSPSGGVKFSAAPTNPQEFQRWFKNSKAVNQDGTPQRWLHGTPVSFKQFGKGRSGAVQGEDGPFFFSQNPEFTEDYSLRRNYAGGDRGPVEEGGRTIPVYLSVQNPFDYQNPKDVAAVVSKLREMHDNGRYPLTDKSERGSPDVLENRLETLGYDLEDGDWPTIEKENVQRAIRELGYDGFFVKENKQRNLAVYKPEQVKSIFNRFEEGAATDARFSAAPLSPYIQQQNSTLFAPKVQVSTRDKIFGHFFDRNFGGKTFSTMHGQINISGGSMAAIAGKQAAIDKNAYITELEKLLNQKTTGNYQRMEANYSATAALAWRRRSSHIFASMLLRGNLEINYATPGDIQSATMKVVDDADSLKEIFNIITQPGPTNANGKQDDKTDIFRSYAVARRGEWLRSTGQNVPRELTPQYIREVTDFTQREYPEVIEAYNKYQRFNKKLLTTAKDAGLISPAELGRLTNQMNYYGFIYEAYGEPLGPSSSQKTASKFKLRPYTGTQVGGLTSDPMFVMMQNAQFWVDSIAKNIAATKSFELCRQMGEARILGTDEAPDELAGEAKDVMFFSQNGVVKRFAVKDPMLAAALGSDDRINVGKFWEALGLPSHVLRESVTRDPGFMARNLLRDTVAAWITSGADFMPVIDTIKGGLTALKGGASYKALGSYGVVGSYDLAMLGPAELSALLKRNSMPLNVHTAMTKEGATAALGSLWNRLGHISEASDAATRIAVYEACKKQGMSDAEAAMQAIELLDFTRRGGSQTLGILTKLIPFLNARIQGMDVVYQAGRSGIRYAMGKSLGERDANVGKRFLLRGGILAIISTALEALNQGDDDYEQLDDYIKTGNLVIPLKEFGLKGQFLAIPKAFEAGLLFSTIPQQIYKTTTGEASTRENAQLFWGQIQATLGVNPIPQAILPGIEILTNHNFYTGLPLISEGKLRLDPSLQYNTSTSQIAMMLGGLPIYYDMTTGKFGGMSPIVIDKLISGYGGPIGSYLVQATSLAMEDAKVGPDRMPSELSSLPIVKSFFIDAKSKNPKIVTQAYELFRIADEANRTMSRLRQMGDAEALANYVDENRDVLRYKQYIFKLADSLNKLSAQERSIERDGSMTRDEKLAAQQKLREIRIRLASNVDQINKTLGR